MLLFGYKLRGDKYFERIYYYSSYSFYCDMDFGIPRDCKTFKRDKLEENDNLTFYRNFIGVSYNYFTYSKFYQSLGMNRVSLDLCRFTTVIEINFPNIAFGKITRHSL